MRIRTVKMKYDTADGPVEYGAFYQLVRYYRDVETKQPRTEVLVHLGEQPTVEGALKVWPEEVEHLRRIRRGRLADKLEAKLRRLRELHSGEQK